MDNQICKCQQIKVQPTSQRKATVDPVDFVMGFLFGAAVVLISDVMLYAMQKQFNKGK